MFGVIQRGYESIYFLTNIARAKHSFYNNFKSNQSNSHGSGKRHPTVRDGVQSLASLINYLIKLAL